MSGHGRCIMCGRAAVKSLTRSWGGKHFITVALCETCLVELRES